MKYLGGKSRIAKEIASVISPQGYWWDAFCGGLSVSCALSDYGPGLVSDINAPLIALYRAVTRGWQPPESLSREEWNAAKTLPDHDPIKAFAGIGCSVQGLWFDTYYPTKLCPPSKSHPKGMNQNPAKGARSSLLRDCFKLSVTKCSIAEIDFLEMPVRDGLFDCVYLDPPYEGTRSYGYVSEFDHEAFWKRAETWAKLTRVFVSEIRCPIDHDIVWEHNYSKRLGASGENKSARLERLFRLKG